MAVIISGAGIDMGQNAISKWEVINKIAGYIESFKRS